MFNPLMVMNMLSKVKSNPLGMLSQQGLNVPKNVNDPHEIANYLVSSGQIPQNVINQAMQVAQSMGIKL